MEENLVGYLLRALDPETQRQVESEVRGNPEALRRLKALWLALEPLDADRDDDDEPPDGLVWRTLGRVAEKRVQEMLQRRLELPRAPQTIPIRTAATPRRWWRRADVLVAAVLLLALAGLFWPMVSTLRSRNQRLACQDNLRAIHQALVAYSDQHHGAFPRVADEPRRNVAGIFVPMLHDGGYLGQDVSLRCPGRDGDPVAAAWSLRDLSNMSEKDFRECAKKLAGCYAYALGYRDADGYLHGLTRAGDQLQPILADRPFVADASDFRAKRDNSPNHDGEGQNVLFVGGHVEFMKHHSLKHHDGDDDFFVNRHHRPRAGLDEWDYVLGASDDRP